MNVREVINPFRIKRRAPKYSLECEHFREELDDTSGRLRIYDLWTEGDTLSELIDNAQYWVGGRNEPADDANAEVWITLAFLEKQQGERK